MLYFETAMPGKRPTLAHQGGARVSRRQTSQYDRQRQACPPARYHLQHLVALNPKPFNNIRTCAVLHRALQGSVLGTPGRCRKVDPGGQAAVRAVARDRLPTSQNRAQPKSHNSALAKTRSAHKGRC